MSLVLELAKVAPAELRAQLGKAKERAATLRAAGHAESAPSW